MPAKPWHEPVATRAASTAGTARAGGAAKRSRAPGRRNAEEQHPEHAERVEHGDEDSATFGSGGLWG
eukprot:11769910-Alexandrium_andersonii.AAC.1